MTIITPSIHLNGTSKSELLQQNISAMDAIRKAIEALRFAAPNGRDYYPQGKNAANMAVNQHIDRLRRLEDVKDEIEAIACAIVDQR